MTALINQELAKLDKQDRAYGGSSSDPTMDVVREAWEMGQEQRAWKERKNAQMQKMMELQVEGYQTNFGTDDINKKHERLQSYISKNRSRMTDVTLEYADILQQNIGDHRDKVVAFNEVQDAQKADTDNWMDLMEEYGEKESLQPEDVNQLTTMIGEYASNKDDIVTNYADFLGLPQFKHVLTNMVDKERIIRDLLIQAEDDNFLDEHEIGYLSKALETGDSNIITREEKKSDLDKSLRAEQLIKGDNGLFNTLNEYKQYDNLLSGLPTTIPGLEAGIVVNPDQDGFDQGALDDAAMKQGIVEQKLKDLDDRYIELLHQGSFVKDHIDNWGEEGKGLSQIQKNELKKLGYGEGDIASMDIPFARNIINTQKVHAAETKDGSEFGTIGLAIPVAYGAARIGAPALVKASKYVADQSVAAAKYIQYVTNLPADDIIKLYDNGNIKKSVGVIERLKSELADIDKPNSKAFKEAQKKLNDHVAKVVKSLTSGAGKKSPVLTKINPADLKKLLMNSQKWNIVKLKGNAFKHYPQLAKGLIKNLPAGGYGSYSIASHIGETLGDPTGGLATGVAGYGTYKGLKKLIDRKGSKYVYQKLLTKLPAKIASKIITGVAIAKHPGAGIALGTGMALYDIVDIVNSIFSEEEE